MARSRIKISDSDPDLIDRRAEFAQEFVQLMNDYKNKTGKYAEKKDTNL